MIARSKISRNEWKAAERGAFEVGNFAPFCCPGLGAPCGDGTAHSTAPKLLSLAFAYGRYLLASSSRRGGLPANLQGVWADGAFFGVPARFGNIPIFFLSS